MREKKIDTSAEGAHRGKVNLAPQKGPDSRLFVDLDICGTGVCDKCEALCSYFYHPQNYGIISVAELANYVLVCRRCEEPHCVNACPYEALEQQRDLGKLLMRNNLRCVSCKSCSHACPYGTIYPENLPQLTHICDYCLDRRDQKGEPLCIKGCPHGALQLRKADEALDENTYLVGDHLIIHSTHWKWEKA